jgi:hypothetical protein
MLGKLRMAFSAVSGITCLLIVVLWIRSDLLADIFGVTFAGQKRCGVASEKGRVFAIVFDYKTFLWAIGKRREWDIRSQSISSLYPMARTEAELIQQMGIPSFPGFYAKRFNGYYRVIVPHWFLVMLFAAFTLAPWLNRMKLRFSLLSLFIVMTLIAGVLGIFLARDWVNTEPQNTIPELPPDQFPAGAPRFTPVSVPSSWFVFATNVLAELRFVHHFGDRQLDGRNFGQTDLADIDRHGDLDFIVGEQRGRIFWYEYQAADRWTRHELGVDSPSDVGGAALDVNRDGWVDFVAGGAWYENPKIPRERPFARHVFDADLAAVHDLILGDVDGDGRTDMLTMSDQNDVRWYQIPSDAARMWKATHIGPAVHSGISLGDLDGDGDQDVVRSNVWFENNSGGQQWTMHTMSDPWGASEPPFAVNATQTATVDLNRDGWLDVVICDGENPSSKIAWLEAPENPRSGPWTTHPLPRGDDDARGALHSLVVADFDGDGDADIFTVEMERFPGKRPPRWFIWENVDGKGQLVERVILDANLGGHEAVVGDVDGDGDLDICAKPWEARRTNALGGANHFDFLQNVSRPDAGR